MKVTLNRKGDVYSVYVPKKDLEAEVVSVEKAEPWGGTFTLDNGWVLDFGKMEEEPALPKTLEAKLVSRGD